MMILCYPVIMHFALEGSCSLGEKCQRVFSITITTLDKLLKKKDREKGTRSPLATISNLHVHIGSDTVCHVTESFIKSERKKAL